MPSRVLVEVRSYRLVEVDEAARVAVLCQLCGRQKEIGGTLERHDSTGAVSWALCSACVLVEAAAMKRWPVDLYAPYLYLVRS